MRRATSGTEFLKHGGRVVGVSLGFDFCAEHESGMAGVSDWLGLQSEAADWAEARRIRRFDLIHEIATTTDSRTGWGLLVSRRPHRSLNQEVDSRVLALSYLSEGCDLTASWDKDELCIVAWSEDAINTLKELLLSIKEGHTVLASGHPLPVGGGCGPCIVRTDCNPEIWVGFLQERAEAARLLAQRQKDWAEETKGLGQELVNMSRGVSMLLCDTEALTYNYYNWPAHYLPVSHGKQEGKPDRFAVDESGTLHVWLNPNRQDLFPAAWVSSADLWRWSRGDGPLWPLGAMMPRLNHPFWCMIEKKLPPPDNGEWDVSYPWSKGGTYVDGEYLWTKLEAILGFTALTASMVKGAAHHAFAWDHDAGEKQDLPTVVTVRDEMRFRSLIDYWNESCRPGYAFQPYLFGRGQTEFCNRLAEAKLRAQSYVEDRKNGLVK